MVDEKDVSKEFELIPSSVGLGRLFSNEEIKVSLKAFPEEELNEFSLSEFSMRDEGMLEESKDKDLKE